MKLPDAIWRLSHDYWLIRWILPVLVYVLFHVFSRLIANSFFRLLSLITKKSGKQWIGELEEVFYKPFRVLMICIGLFIALRIMPYYGSSPGLWAVTVKCFRSAVILIIAWGLCRLEGHRALKGLSFLKKEDSQTNTILLPFLSKTLRFVTVAIALLIIAQEWNYSISGLLAGLGLGGLAFALAAKDMLSNVFGGIVILVDKPFGIGDWISTDSVEGTVEDINFRSVKVRTFTQAVVTVPNAVLVDQPITNFSRMGKRKVSFTVGLSIRTGSGQMKDCVAQIGKVIAENDEVEKDTSVVAFDSIGESSLNLMVSFFTATTDWEKHLRIKEEIQYAILDILKRAGAELAYPIQALQTKENGKIIEK